MKSVFSIEEAAKICKVSPQTIIRCFDHGQIKGFRVPGSGSRRIPREALYKFLRDNGIPTETLENDKRRVLLVDDDRVLTESMRKSLEGDGRFEVSIASNGFDAGMMVKDHRPDIIVLEVVLTDISGKEVCQLVRADHTLEAMRILCISGEMEEEKIQELRLCGADDFMPKPFAIDALISRMCCLLDIEPLDDGSPCESKGASSAEALAQQVLPLQPMSEDPQLPANSKDGVEPGKPLEKSAPTTRPSPVVANSLGKDIPVPLVGIHDHTSPNVSRLMNDFMAPKSVDFFISYNKDDRDWAEWIGWQLEAASYKVIVQAWDFLPGGNFVLNMQRASLDAKRTIAVLSQTYLDSLFTQPEWAAAFAKDPTGAGGSLLPVRVRECYLGGMLAAIGYADLIGLDQAEARTRLLTAAQGGRAKPAVSPRYPGPAAPFPTSTAPRPIFRDQRTHELSDKAEQLRKRRQKLRESGASSEALQAVERQLVEVKREIREGPLLHEGDCLSDRYFLVEQLGSGGFATVWRAFDEQTNHQVALKVLHGRHLGNDSRRQRFRRGARAMRRLGEEHPHVVRVLDCEGEDGGYHYFVMEYVAGGTFARAVMAGALSVEKRIGVILEVGAALEFAHGCRILHRDVTPDNILLDGPTVSGVARLSDFDLVQLDESGVDTTGPLGKHIYAAPECMESGSDADARCDVYSLGMTAVFAYHGMNLPHAMLRQWERFFDKLDCPNAVKAVLARATAHDRDSRFSSMKEFCAALTKGLTQNEAEPAQPIVLVVDDSALDLHLAGAIINQMAGWRATFAANGVEALAAMEHQVPDVVLTDILMPDMDGLQLIAAIRSRYPSVPVIVMTAHGSEEIARQSLKQGAASYLPKMNLASDLTGTLEDVLTICRRKTWRRWL